MKAAVYRRYGAPEVVHIEEVPTPVPKSNEVLIKIHATTVSAADWRLRSLNMPQGFGWLARPIFGFFSPRQPILGTELAGEIVETGKTVIKFKVGDKVFAHPGEHLGCHAEYRTLAEDGPLCIMPPDCSYTQAAAIAFGGTTALHFLQRQLKLQVGESILIVGASGAVGSAAVQIARNLGAKVTGVCSGKNVAFVRELGANDVIDYTQGDYLAKEEYKGRFDVVIDTVGAGAYPAYKTVLKPNGRLGLVACGLFDMLDILFASWFSNHKVFAGPALGSAKDLQELAELVEVGKYAPVIDSVLPLSRIVEAHRLVDSGRKKGNVVIKVV